ncbi:DUF2569 domain-containing protein [Orbus mooreae]|uniref:DUF2569 domain-containing protein n=1 Tax=Orbus mooreae TaxID=3074107 RepID=UPI00370D71C7
MTNTNNLTGIGGWLILVAIRIVVAPLSLLFFIVVSLNEIVFSGLLQELSSMDSPYYLSGFLPVYLIEVAINIFFLLLSIYLAYLFFTKNYKTPKIFIINESAYLVFLVIDTLVCTHLFDYYEADIQTIKDIVKSFIACCIWIPYFLISVRVKNTFINGRSNSDIIANQSGLVS